MSARPETFGELLRRLRLTAELTQEDLAERAHVSPRAISDLERGARSRPWRETVRLLADALHLEPPDRDRLEAAARQVRPASSSAPIRAFAPGAAAPRHNLPVPVTSFVGRGSELAEVSRLLAGTHLLTLTGAGGCGKTRLALRLAADCVEAYPDGVWLADLAPLTDPEGVPDRVMAALGLPDLTGQSILSTLLAALRSRRALLLLDNCEHLLEACARLADALLKECPDVRILATSREALRVAGEVVFRVPSLETPPRLQPETPDVLTAFDSVRLFLDRADAAGGGFTLTAANASAVAEICRRLDGIPLAIELAAARTGALGVQQIAARLDRRFRLLTGGSRAALPRHQTLAASVAWSYDLLSESERTLLDRLSVFAGGFDLEAAERVCGEAPLAPEDVLVRLASLVDQSLVVAEPAGGGEMRYRLLWTIREFARERLASTGEADAVARRHAECYLAVAEDCSAADYEAGQGDAFVRLDRELDNLRLAMNWSVSREIEWAVRLVTALGNYWSRRGRDRDHATRWIADLLPRRHAFPPTEALARFLLTVSWFAEDGATYRQVMEECVSVSRAVGQRHVAARALHGLAYSAAWREDHARARALYAESLADAEPGLRPWVLANLGDLDRRTGDVVRARLQLEAAAAESRQVGIAQNIGYALDHLGKLERVQGNLARAVTLSEESRSAFRDAGDEMCVAWLDRALGRLARIQGDLARARLWQEQALAGAGDSHLWRLKAEVLDELGLIAAAEGNLTVARRHFDEALAIARESLPRQTAELTASLGLVARAEGNLAEARELFNDAMAFWREAGYPHAVAIIQGHLGVVALQEGNLRLAGDLFATSLEIRHALGDQGGTATLLECFAGLAALSDEPDRAFRLLGAADRTRSAIGNPAPPVWMQQRDPWIEPARQALDATTRLQAFVTGQTTGLDLMIADALHVGRRV